MEDREPEAVTEPPLDEPAEAPLDEPDADHPAGVAAPDEDAAAAAAPVPAGEPGAEVADPEAEVDEPEAEVDEPAAGIDEDVALQPDEGDEDDEDDEPPFTGFDRRPDVLSWVLVPVLALVLGPALAFSAGVLVAEAGGTDYPTLCRDAIAGNQCEETVLRMLGWHGAAFLIGWLAAWAIPWRRGWRPYRIGFGVLLVLILIAAPLRLLSTMQVTSQY